MTHRFATVSVLAVLLLGACGDEGTSPADARRIIVAGFVNDGGVSRDVAECVADRALAEHDPSELVNRRGTTSDAVNASVEAITRACLAELTPTTTTTVPPTTTTPATTVPVDYSAFCPAATDVAVALAAGRALDQPGPAAFEGWFDTLSGRVELAVLTAPTPAAQDAPLAISAALKALAAPLAAAGYDLVALDPATRTRLDEVQALGDDLAGFLADGCEIDVAADAGVAADARRLAAELAERDVPTTTVAVSTTLPPADVQVDHAGAGIRLLIPETWAGEEGGATGDASRYLIRAVDVATFRDTDFGGEGVGILARDGTADWVTVADTLPHRTRCTLVSDDAYDDGVYTGRLWRFDDCAGAAGPIVVVAAADTVELVAVIVEIRVPTIDSPAIDTVLNSFYV